MFYERKQTTTKSAIATSIPGSHLWKRQICWRFCKRKKHLLGFAPSPELGQGHGAVGVKQVVVGGVREGRGIPPQRFHGIARLGEKEMGGKGGC